MVECVQCGGFSRTGNVIREVIIDYVMGTTTEMGLPSRKAAVVDTTGIGLLVAGLVAVFWSRWCQSIPTDSCFRPRYYIDFFGFTESEIARIQSMHAAEVSLLLVTGEVLLLAGVVALAFGLYLSSPKASSQ